MSAEKFVEMVAGRCVRALRPEVQRGSPEFKALVETLFPIVVHCNPCKVSFRDWLVLRCPYAGVVLRFKAGTEGHGSVTVWRLPESERFLGGSIACETYDMDRHGLECGHGACTTECPPPGPHAIPKEDDA